MSFSKQLQACLIRLPQSRPRRPVPALSLGQTQEKRSWGRNAATQGMLQAGSPAARGFSRHSPPLEAREGPRGRRWLLPARLGRRVVTPRVQPGQLPPTSIIRKPLSARALSPNPPVTPFHAVSCAGLLSLSSQRSPRARPGAARTQRGPPQPLHLSPPSAFQDNSPRNVQIEAGPEAGQLRLVPG